MFIENTSDDLRCYQAALRMAWHEIGLGDPGLARMDRLTLFSEGQQTWPFAGMLATADAGRRVTSVEDFDPLAFVADARAELLRQTDHDEDLVGHIFEVSDVGAQRDLVSRCVDHPRVRFDQRIPTWGDLLAYVESGAAVICNVNAKALAGDDGYNGHFVLVDRVDEARAAIRTQDPGLPPRPDQWVDQSTFIGAWAVPERLANILVIDR